MDRTEPEHIRNLFQRRGIRCTRQRESIYRALAATKAHPTAEELFNMVSRSAPGISLATIYNTLETFTAHGLCQRLPAAHAGAGACRFDADMSEHPHLVMPDGSVQDLPPEMGEQIRRRLPQEVVDRVQAEFGVSIDRVNIHFVAAHDDPDSNA